MRTGKVREREALELAPLIRDGADINTTLHALPDDVEAVHWSTLLEISNRAKKMEGSLTIVVHVETGLVFSQIGIIQVSVQSHVESFLAQG